MACCYYLLSMKRSKPADGCYTWWRPQRAGYTVNLNEAGLYREAEAQQLADGADTFAVPAKMVESATVLRVEYGRLDGVLKRASDAVGYCPACQQERPSLPWPAVGTCAACCNHLVMPESEPAG